MSNGQSWKVNGKKWTLLNQVNPTKVFSVKSFELIKVELKIKMDKTLPPLNNKKKSYKLVFFEK